MRKVKTFKIYQFFMIKENAQVLGDEFLQHYILRTWKVWSLSFWMLYLKFSWDNFSWFYRFKRTHIKKIIYIWFGTDNSIFQMCLFYPIRKYCDSSLAVNLIFLSSKSVKEIRTLKKSFGFTSALTKWTPNQFKHDQSCPWTIIICIPMPSLNEMEIHHRTLPFEKSFADRNHQISDAFF